jgi:hypothetical protein
LGRLVRDGKIRALEEIYLFSLPIKVIYIYEHVLIFYVFKCRNTCYKQRNSVEPCILQWGSALDTRMCHLGLHFCRIS